ncbi:MAG: oxidoreductase [Aquificaceae bacterium]|nr:oxidoreductase [Aquificaceae bacterium]
MHPIVEKVKLSEKACLLKIKAEHISRAMPGQFVMLQHRETSEPVPLSILEVSEGYFTCFVKGVGKSTLELIEEAENLFYVAGPLGKPFPLGHYRKVAFYTHSWGIAPALNVAKALKAQGKELLLFHTSEDFYLQEEAGRVFDEVIHDGELRALHVDLVASAGSNRLSKRLTSIYSQKPVISMVNTHMLDAVGLCLVCRVLVEGKQRLACTDGPWFEAHLVDWANLIERESAYEEQEKLALEEYRKALRRKSLKA